MARKPPLKVVPPDARSKPPPPKTVVAAAEVSERAMLVALRRRLAIEIDTGVPSHALAALTRQLREIDKAIREIDSRDPDVNGSADVAGDEPFDPDSI